MADNSKRRSLVAETEASLVDADACAAAVPAEAAAALAELFAPVPFAAGREISLREREARGVQHERIFEASYLVYGEASAAVVARVRASCAEATSASSSARSAAHAAAAEEGADIAGAALGTREDRLAHSHTEKPRLVEYTYSYLP